jgi:hypothetical protein
MKNTVMFMLASLLVGCRSSAPEVSVPVAAFADGSTFQTPCMDHGSHTQTIDSSRLDIIYNMTSDIGEEGVVIEEQLIEWMELTGTVIDATVVVR